MKIEHVAIWVSNLESSRNFYTKFFGGTSNEKYINESKGFQSYFISFPSGARLELMNQVNIHKKSANHSLGYAHLAFSVGSKEKVDEMTEYLKLKGVIINSQPRTTGDGYYESTVLDPDGNIIEITI